MAQVSLNRHEVLGTLTYPQVDINWTQLQGTVNQLVVDFESSFAPSNLTATAAPTASDDGTDGYNLFSRWFFDDVLYVLTDPTPGAAVWVETDFDTLGFGSASMANLGALPDDVPQNKDLSPDAFSNIEPEVTSGSGSFSFNHALSDNHYREITGNSTITAPTGARLGQSGKYFIAQDATGGRTLDLSAYAVVGSPTIDDDPEAVNIFEYFVRSLSPLIVTLIYHGVES